MLFRSFEIVEDLLAEVGPAYYRRSDLRLSRPVAKQTMTDYMLNNAPKEIGGEAITSISTLDGIKYLLADDSWLLIRPSGTEPVLRVYAEGRNQQIVDALLGYGKLVADEVT